jgi:hypothetical protein
VKFSRDQRAPRDSRKLKRHIKENHLIDGNIDYPLLPVVFHDDIKREMGLKLSDRILQRSVVIELDRVKMREVDRLSRFE